MKAKQTQLNLPLISFGDVFGRNIRKTVLASFIKTPTATKLRKRHYSLSSFLVFTCVVVNAYLLCSIGSGEGYSIFLVAVHIFSSDKLKICR